MNTIAIPLSHPWPRRLIGRLRNLRWRRRAQGWREVDAHTLRDLAVDISEIGSIAAEAAGAAPATRRRMAGGSVAVALVAAVAAGCASVGAPQDAHTLAGYERLQVQPDGTRAWRDAALGRPSVVVVDGGAIGFGAGVPLEAAEQQLLRDALHQALVDRLGAAGLRVQGDEPDRLTLRATITAVERAQPALNAVTTVLLFAPLSYGGLSVEIEAFDAVGGHRIAAMAFVGRAGLQDFGAAFSDLGHARAQADVVAERFAALLMAPAYVETVSGASPGRALR